MLPWNQAILCAWLARCAYAEAGAEEACSANQCPSLIQKAQVTTLKVQDVAHRPAEPQAEFLSFMRKHGHDYLEGTQEYAARASLFQQRLEEVNRLNKLPDRLWTAGISWLSDRTDDELRTLRGWKGGVSPGRHAQKAGGHGRGMGLLSINGRTKPLPKEVSWTHLNASKTIRNQGSCGSCWAIASVTVLDAHAEIHVPHDARSFSAQELVSCVPNPESCGGSGGCDGATVELALNWAMQHGRKKIVRDPPRAASV